MDKKTSTTLDPKLKEVYERVMGTSFSPQSAKPQPQSVAPSVATTQPKTSTPPPAAAAPAAQAAPLPQPAVHAASAPTFVAKKPPIVANKNGAFVGKRGVIGRSNISPVFLIILAVVFFIVYTIFWIKIFGLQFPF